jgi:hypothetical protein
VRDPVVASVFVQVEPVLVQPVQAYEVGEPMHVAVSVIDVPTPGVVLLDDRVHDGGVGPESSDRSQSAMS